MFLYNNYEYWMLKVRQNITSFVCCVVRCTQKNFPFVISKHLKVNYYTKWTYSSWEGYTEIFSWGVCIKFINSFIILLWCIEPLCFSVWRLTYLNVYVVLLFLSIELFELTFVWSMLLLVEMFEYNWILMFLLFHKEMLSNPNSH